MKTRVVRGRLRLAILPRECGRQHCGARTRACRVETHLDAFPSISDTREGVAMSRDAARPSACATTVASLHSKIKWLIACLTLPCLAPALLAETVPGRF